MVQPCALNVLQVPRYAAAELWGGGDGVCQHEVFRAQPALLVYPVCPISITIFCSCHGVREGMKVQESPKKSGSQQWAA